MLLTNTSSFVTELYCAVKLSLVNVERSGEELQIVIWIDLLQDVIDTLEQRLMPLVNAELSVLVDVLHQPELLFLEGTDARTRCESGGFISK